MPSKIVTNNNNIAAVRVREINVTFKDKMVNYVITSNGKPAWVDTLEATTDILTLNMPTVSTGPFDRITSVVGTKAIINLLVILHISNANYVVMDAFDLIYMSNKLMYPKHMPTDKESIARMIREVYHKSSNLKVKLMNVSVVAVE